MHLEWLPVAFVGTHLETRKVGITEHHLFQILGIWASSLFFVAATKHEQNQRTNS